MSVEIVGTDDLTVAADTHDPQPARRDDSGAAAGHRSATGADCCTASALRCTIALVDTAELARVIGARVRQEPQVRRWTLDHLAETAG